MRQENVLLSGDDECKVCDFGLAHLYEDDGGGKLKRETLYEVCGSKSYAAPEILASRGYDGYSVDVWSCGICLFAMLAGFFPLDGATPSDWRFTGVVQAVAQGESLTHTIFGFYERPCVLSKEAADLIDAMLNLHQSTRPSVSAVLTHSWLTGVKKAVPDQLHDYEDLPRYRIARYDAQAEAALCKKIGVQMSLDMSFAENDDRAPVYRGMPDMSAEVYRSMPDMSSEVLMQPKGGRGPPTLSRQHAFGGASSPS